MSKVDILKRMLVGVGAFIIIGTVGNTVIGGNMFNEGNPKDVEITVSAESQNQIEALIGDKLKGYFSIGDGKYNEGTSKDVEITVSAENQKRIETSLVGDKTEGYFYIGDGKYVFVEKR